MPARALAIAMEQKAYGAKRARSLSPTDRAEESRVRIRQGSTRMYNQISHGGNERTGPQVNECQAHLGSATNRIIVHNLPPTSIREIEFIFAVYEPYHVHPLGVEGQAIGGNGRRLIKNFSGSTIISLSSVTMQEKAVESMNNTKVEGYTITVLAWNRLAENVYSLEDADRVVSQSMQYLLSGHEMTRGRLQGSSEVFTLASRSSPTLGGPDVDRGPDTIAHIKKRGANVAPPGYDGTTNGQAALRSMLGPLVRSNFASQDPVGLLIRHFQINHGKRPVFKATSQGQRFSCTVRIGGCKEPFGTFPSRWFSNKKTARKYACQLAMDWLIKKSVIGVADVAGEAIPLRQSLQPAQKPRAAHDTAMTMVNTQSMQNGNNLVHRKRSDHIYSDLKRKSEKSKAALKNCETKLKLAAKKIKEARRNCDAMDLQLVSKSLRTSFSKDFFKGLQHWNEYGTRGVKKDQRSKNDPW